MNKLDTETITGEWPGGVSSGLVLQCWVCRIVPKLDYTVEDEVWKQVVPESIRNLVICLECFDKMATRKGVDWIEHLQKIQLTGIGKTMVLVPQKIWYYKKP